MDSSFGLQTLATSPGGFLVERLKVLPVPMQVLSSYLRGRTPPRRGKGHYASFQTCSSIAYYAFGGGGGSLRSGVFESRSSPGLLTRAVFDNRRAGTVHRERWQHEYRSELQQEHRYRW